MASRGICINYGVEDFEDDIRTLKELGELWLLSAILHLLPT
jgi:hypothetical protein